MTEKLFYEDSYLKSFEAQVVACEAYKEGYAVVLNATAFYPEGGGQASDKGTLGDAEVSYVFIKEDIIYHVTNKPLEIGLQIEGTIDFVRRFDYMQQHSGEHIVSGIVRELYGYNNVGFHLSDHYMTADFDGELTAQNIIDIEKCANEAVFRNIEVVANRYAKEEIENIDYRSKIELTGEIRLVAIKLYDLCACCGTHVKYTSEIGIIKIIASEKHKNGTRITILCGRRALNDYTNKHEIVAGLSSLLSSKIELIQENVNKLQQDLADAKQKNNLCLQELLTFKAKEYIKETTHSLCILEENFSSDELRKFCDILIDKTSQICLVLTCEGEFFKYALGCREKDVRSLCEGLNKTFAGRGGGKPEMCQGSLKGSYEEIEQYFKQHS